MIVMHADPDCRACRLIRDDLEETGAACKVIVEGDTAAAHRMIDDGEEIRGHHAMVAHLEDLDKLLARWTAFQSDTCYLFEEGWC